VEEAGGKGLACIVDIRDEEAVAKSIEETVKTFGGIDIVVNNASAISLTNTEVRPLLYNNTLKCMLNNRDFQVTPMKKYDLMNQINARGTYLV